MENRTWKQIKTSAILIFDNAMPRQHGSRVRRMTELGSYGRGVVQRPFPAWLIGCAAKLDASNADNFKSTMRKFANLVRLVEGL